MRSSVLRVLGDDLVRAVDSHASCISHPALDGVERDALRLDCVERLDGVDTGAYRGKAWDSASAWNDDKRPPNSEFQASALPRFTHTPPISTYLPKLSISEREQKTLFVRARSCA